jgi:Na+-transporting NADH:ubiquinone oxidoreductase subunit F
VRVSGGGGQILPTEELFMSRQEKAEGMRLACQLKVKNDVAIVIPDYLTVVRQMAVNKKFDPNKRWKVTIY